MARSAYAAPLLRAATRSLAPSTAQSTLNVKNLPDGLYRKLQARAKRERRSVAQEVTHILANVLETPRPLSILELQELGREAWRGIDAASHVRAERDAWD